MNTSALEYAPSISVDLLELFFTRMTGTARAPRTSILRATRRAPGEPFGRPERVAALTGFVEAPSLSSNGRSLYFHRLDGARYVIHRVAR